MLVHPLKVVFIHIPKTAGQSIERCLLGHLDIPWESRDRFLLRQNREPSKGPPMLAHLTAMEYLSYDYLKPQKFTEYFKFSFVRNPWARLVSEYNWRGHHKKWSFKNWLLRHFPKPGWTDVWRHVMPQYDYLFNTDGHCLVDFIGHFERLEEDFNQVRTCIEGEMPELPHTNQVKQSVNQEWVDIVSLWGPLWGPLWGKVGCKAREKKKKPPKKSLSYLDYYDCRTWAWVAKRYQQDIETFGYTHYIDKFDQPQASRLLHF